jgi:hypothetical protein
MVTHQREGLGASMYHFHKECVGKKTWCPLAAKVPLFSQNKYPGEIISYVYWLFKS